MRIQYISDLHLEFCRDAGKKTIASIRSLAPVLVMAGDLGDPARPSYTDLLKHTSQIFSKIFIVAGNHEYYHRSIAETEALIQNSVEDFQNISYLQNSSEVYKDHLFVGTTLWSHISNPVYLINDFEAITDITVQEYNKLHQTAVDFLESVTSQKKNVVVITHHLPSCELIDSAYAKYANYNQCFASDTLQKMSNPSNIKAWFFGHTHKPVQSTIRGVPLFCNPYGYPGENPARTLDTVVDLTSDTSLSKNTTV